MPGSAQSNPLIFSSSETRTPIPFFNPQKITKDTTNLKEQLLKPLELEYQRNSKILYKVKHLLLLATRLKSLLTASPHFSLRSRKSEPTITTILEITPITITSNGETTSHLNVLIQLLILPSIMRLAFRRDYYSILIFIISNLNLTNTK